LFRIQFVKAEMIIPGRVAVARKIISNLYSPSHQAQPCGVDLALKRIMTWSSAGTIDFDNTHRKSAKTVEVPFRRVLPSTTADQLSENRLDGNPATLSRLRKGEPKFAQSTSSFQGVSVDQRSTSYVESDQDFVHLEAGAYLVEFNELVDMPLDIMGQIMVRSSLFRSGVLITAGVMDSGYKGAVGAMLQVVNPYGLTLLRNAKLAQMVFHQMSERTEGYSGTYQGSTHM
jgi:dUTP pyrophosphatase